MAKHFTAYGYLFVVVGLTMGSQAQEPFFQPTDGPYGGMIPSILVLTRGTVVASGYGIHLSADAGHTWKASLSQGNYGSGIYGLAIGSSDSILIAASTDGRGVLKSIDRGLTWQSRGTGTSMANLSTVARDALNGDIYTGGSRGNFNSGILYRSTDDGETWSLILGENLYFKVVAQLLATTRGDMFMLTDSRWVWRLINDGQSWQGLPIPADSMGHPTNLGLTQDERLLIGDNRGNILEFISDTSFIKHLLPESVPVWTLLAMDSLRLLAGTNKGVFRSTDHGINWQLSNTGLRHLFITTLVRDTATGTVYCGTTSGGVYQSTNHGRSWAQASQGIRGLKISTIAISSITGSIIVGTREDGGVFRSSDKGESWALVDGLPINKGPNANHLFEITSMIDGGGGNIFARGVFYNDSLRYDQSSLFRFNDGNNWESVPLPPNVSLDVLSYDALNNTLYAGAFLYSTRYIHRSTDKGNTWAISAASQHIQDVRSIGVSLQGNVFVGCGSYGDTATVTIVYSTNHGNNWISRSSGLSRNDVVAIVCSPVTGNIFASTTTGIYKSTDEGENWYLVNQSFGSWTLRALSNGNLYIGVTDGTFESSDEGNTWRKIWSQPLSDFALDKEGYLFARYGYSIGSMIVRSTRPIVTSISDITKDIPKQFHLSQNYPNPFNPVTSIEYEVPSMEYVSIRIFNLLGEEVATLVNERKEPGRYQVRWDGSDYPSGIYFYTFTAGNFRETRKLLLMK